MEDNKPLINFNISEEKKDELIKLIAIIKDELKDNFFEKIEDSKSDILLEMQKEINVIGLFCINMKKELDELKEEVKDLRDSFLMKVMMEKVAYVPLEKLPIYKNKSKE